MLDVGSMEVEVDGGGGGFAAAIPNRISIPLITLYHKLINNNK